MIQHLAAQLAQPLAIALLAVTALAAQGQAYPSRPVTLVVPFPPGGGTDTGGRILAEQLGKRWGQTVIVENKGGAAGQIGAKGKPGQLSYASSGAGGAPHLAAEMFKQASGTFIVHVPYRGGGPATQDLMAGHVQLLFMTVLEASGNIKAGKLRALAVTSDKRVPALADVPTLAEAALPGFNSISWLGLLAPAGTPAEVVEKISADVRAVLADEAVRARFVGLGGVPRGTTSAEFAKLIESDRARYARIIAERKITLD